jgi:hypothetical protein
MGGVLAGPAGSSFIKVQESSKAVNKIKKANPTDARLIEFFIFI